MSQQEKTLRDVTVQFGVVFESELDAFMAQRRRQYEAFYFDYVLHEKITKPVDETLRADIDLLINQEATFVERPSFGWSRSIEAKWAALHERIVQWLRSSDSPRLMASGIEQELAGLMEHGRKQRDYIVYQYGGLLDSFEECAELRANGHTVKAQKISLRSFDAIRQVFRTVLDHGPSLTLLHS